MHTELGRSPVEVQRCPLSWEGPRLRSSGAHTELGELGEESWQRAWRVGKAEVEVEVDADMVEETGGGGGGGAGGAGGELAEEEEENNSDKI